MQAVKLKMWKEDNGTEGLQFFAQCLEESLYHHTIDTFRAPSTNLHTNVYELLKLLSDIKDNNLNYGCLSFIIEELDGRIKRDPIVAVYSSDLFKVFLQKLHSCKNIEQLMSFARVVLKELNDNYFTNITLAIKDAISISNNNKVISNLAHLFITECEINGFDRTYVYYESIKFFYDKRFYPKLITSIDVIDEYFRIFTTEDVVWDIVLKSDDDIKWISTYSGDFGIEISGEISHEYCNSKTKKFTDGCEGKLFVIIKDVPAKDHFVAKKTAIAHLDFVIDVCHFYNHELNPHFSEECIVRNSNSGDVFVLKPAPNPMKLSIDGFGLVNINEAENLIDLIKGKYFHNKSIYAFVKAMDLHRSSSDITVPEIQLINLWAAIEAFLPPPAYSQASNRIDHYLDTLLYPLLLTYADRRFTYISRCIRKLSSDAKHIINSIEGKDWKDKISRILVCSDHSEERKDLYKALCRNPLLRYRCFGIFEDFSSTKQIRRTLERHREKVKIHIQRIYTLRNSIIHNGSSLPYISSLILNTHTYVDILIKTVVNVGKKSPHKISISTAIDLLQIHFDVYFSRLNKRKETCNITNYKELLFPAGGAYTLHV